MDQPAAFVFALSMVVWVADVRLAPSHARTQSEPASAVAACETGYSAAAPVDADAELVTCAARIRR
jgi:hypothetical protein